MAAPGSPRLRALDPRAALGRLAIAGAAALAVGGGLWLSHLSVLLAAVAGWDAGGVTWLTMAWVATANADAPTTRARAAAEDIGRHAASVAVMVGSLASLVAATLLARHARNLTSEGERSAFVALCLGAVAIAWALTHTTFMLRYAHVYYRQDDDGVGGIDFPGKTPPTYFDFAYFAFTIGMCFQVSDASVTSAPIRRVVLGHAVISFAFNTVLLAFVLNLVFGAVG